MTDRVDLFNSTYRNFTEETLTAIRRETFGEDIGQNSWLTVEEYERFISWLDLHRNDRVLEVACGSGGPAHYLAKTVQCFVTGVDANESGIETARLMAGQSELADKLHFQVVDANEPLPFADNTFDAITCIDSMNHFPQRLGVFSEWHRVLRPNGRALFTDPVVITGPVTHDELASRSSIGTFLFVPPGVNERFIEQAGFHLIQEEDVTENIALVSGRWHGARQRHQSDLLQIEGAERFEGLQRFFATVHRLTTERRLSRIVYLAEKPVGQEQHL